MKYCTDCGQEAEKRSSGFYYSLCYDCWWSKDARNPQQKLSDEDYRMLEHFYNDKGDVTRWCDWEKKKDWLRRDDPALYHAFQQVEIAHQTLQALLKART